MRFGFVTCVQLGLSCMKAIYEVGGRLDLVITLEDDMARGKSGRIYADDFCRDHGIDLVKVRNINKPEALEAIHARGIDWLFIIGWSQIARREVLEAPKRGVLGMHPTLLPVGRGRAAIPWAILQGLDQTGVTMFKLDEGVDTGPIVAQHVIPLAPDIDATRLYAEVDEAHALLMRDAFPRLQADRIELQAQDESRASEWPGRNREDGLIDENGSVHDAERLVRAVTRPYPGAFVRRGERELIVWRARVAEAGSGSDGLRLHFPDGDLLCLDHEWQPAA